MATTLLKSNSCSTPNGAIKRIASSYPNWRINSTTATHNIRERWLTAKQLNWIFETCEPTTKDTRSIGKTKCRYDVVGADFETITVWLQRTDLSGHIIGRMEVKDFR